MEMYGRTWTRVDNVKVANAFLLEVGVLNNDSNAEWWEVLTLPEGTLMMDNLNGEMLICGQTEAWATKF